MKGGPKLSPVPVTLAEAHAFVRRFHRHHKPSQGGKFAVGVTADGNEVCGVCVVGRPVARRLDDGWTCEVVRCCTDGTPNACSFLYRAAWRAARAMGYRKLVTYTLPDEGGGSLRASGFRLFGEAGGGNWNCASRPRVDTDHQQRKLRWEIEA